MKYFLNVLCLKVCLIVFVLPSQTTRGQEIEGPLAEALQATFERQYNVQQTQGVVAAVSFPGNKIWVGQAGYAIKGEGELIDAEKRIGFASITKTYVAALVMHLVEKGEMGLDLPIKTWLPGLSVNINPDITARQLLSHTSGISDYASASNFRTLASQDLEKYWEPEEIISTFIGPALYEPGTSSGYSNSNFLLLGMILEQVSEKPFAELLQEIVLDPFDMATSYMGSSENSTGSIIPTWFDTNSDGQLDDFTSSSNSPSYQSLRWAAGGIMSAVKDIASWTRVLFTGELLSFESLNEMTQIRDINGTGGFWTGYGLGVMEFKAQGKTFWGHSGAIRGASSLMVYEPDSDIAIAFVANDNRMRREGFLSALYKVASNPAFVTNVEDLELHEIKDSSIEIYPNPSTNNVHVKYHLEKDAGVRIQVFDMLGREVFSLDEPVQKAGNYMFEWDGYNGQDKKVSRGMYVVHIIADQQRSVGKLIRH